MPKRIYGGLEWLRIGRRQAISKISTDLPQNLFDLDVSFRYALRSVFWDMAKISIKDVDLAGKRVLLRVDYNVPMEEENGRMVINDVTRIESTLPTLDRLIEQGAKILLAAHLGIFWSISTLHVSCVRSWR